MRPVCPIVVDVHERPSGVPDLLRTLGAHVEVRSLVAGDYALAADVLVERKTVADLHLSLERGRLLQQIGSIRQAAKLPYLLVEGLDLDGGSVRSNAIRGACLAVVGQGVPIIWSRDTADSARWLWLLSQRAGGLRPSRDRPRYAQRLKPAAALVPEAMLGAVPGISVGTARALLDEFGTVSEIVAAGADAWPRVRGLGKARAHALRRALYG